MTTRTYSSPEAFKQALEQRLRSPTKTGGEFARKRQLLVFDGFLARIEAVLGDAATLKGGLALEFRRRNRVQQARTNSTACAKSIRWPPAGPPGIRRGTFEGGLGR